MSGLAGRAVNETASPVGVLVRRVSHLLQVHSDEWPTVRLGASLSGVTTASFTVGVAYQHSLFLDQFDVVWLPYFYAASALLTVAFSTLYLRAERRHGTPRVARGQAVLTVTGVVAAARGLDPFPAAGLVFLLCLFVKASVELQQTVCWTGVARVLTPRQVKRLMPMVTAGAALGAIAGGGVTAWLAPAGGAELEATVAYRGRLLVVVAALSALVPPLLEALLRDSAAASNRVSRPGQTRRRHSSSSPLPRLTRHPLVVNLAATTLVAGVGWYTVNLYFSAQVSDVFTGAELTVFLAGYAIAVRLVALVVQLLVVGRVATRWGVRGTSLVTPLVLVVGGAVVLLAPHLWVVVLFSLAFEVATTSFFETGRSLGFAPLAQQTRDRALVFVHGIVKPAAAVASSMLLAALASWVPSLIPIALVMVGALWLAPAWGVHAVYLAELRQALRRRHFDSDALVAARIRLGPDSLRMLVDQLVEAKDAVSVEFALSTLRAGAAAGTYLSYAPALLRHPDPDIRVVAYTALAKVHDPRVPEMIATRLSAESTVSVLPHALRAAVQRVAPGTSRRLLDLLDHPSMAVRAEAIHGLFDDADETHRATARGRLDEMVRSQDPATRAAGVSCLDCLGPEAENRLAEAIRDPRPAVRREAISAAGRAGFSSLLPAIVDSADDGRLGAATVHALAAYGDTIVPMLTVSLQRAPPEVAVAPDHRRRVWLRALARVESDQALEVLGQHAGDTDANVRRVVATLLARVAATTPRTGLAAVAARALLLDLERGWAALALVAQVSANAADWRRDLLMTELRQAAESVQRRAFDWLCIVESERRDGLQSARRSFNAGALERQNAVEYLDTVIALDGKSTLLALLEHTVSAAPERLPRVPSEMESLWNAPWTAIVDRLGDRWLWWLVQQLAPAGPTSFDGPAPVEDDESSVALRLERLYLLKRVDLFADFSYDVGLLVADALGEQLVDAGETIFQEGDGPDHLYIIATGQVQVVTNDTVVAVLGEGDHFGEFALIDDRPRSATVRAIEDCRLLTLSDEKFDELLEDHASMARSLIRSLVTRLRHTNTRLTG